MPKRLITANHPQILLAQLVGFTDKALSLTSGIPSRHFACLLHLLEELRELVRFLYLNVDVDLGLLSTTGASNCRLGLGLGHRRTRR
jgi:hypothetical protein